ncbi:MAG: hypothetical protein WBV82_24800 [Myxococcaceae bacterium]
MVVLKSAVDYVYDSQGRMPSNGACAAVRGPEYEWDYCGVEVKTEEFFVAGCSPAAAWGGTSVVVVPDIGSVEFIASAPGQYLFEVIDGRAVVRYEPGSGPSELLTYVDLLKLSR